MGRRLSNINQKITQRSVGLFKWQDDFILENANFNPSPFCRHIISAQIKTLVEAGLADKKWLQYLEVEDEKSTN